MCTKQMPLTKTMAFCSSRLALGILPRAILSYCLGCELFWPYSSKLLSSSAVGRAAGVGIVSWQLCKAETGTLHQVMASTLCEAHHSGMYKAGKSLLEVCSSTNGRETFIMPECCAVPEGQYGHDLPVPKEPRTTKCFVKWWIHAVWFTM